MGISLNRKLIASIIVVLLSASVIISAASPVSFAASSSSDQKYVEITGKPVKAGKYYYKLSGSDKIVRSRKKNTGYSTVIDPKLNFGSSVYTNGKYIYFIRSIYSEKTNEEKNWFVRCTASGKKLKKLKKLQSDYMYSISLIYKNHIYITKHFVAGINTTYSYNMKNGKFIKAASKAGIFDRKGNYVLTKKFSPSEPDIVCVSLHRITRSGKLKKIRDFGTSDGELVGNYVYYAKFINPYGEGLEDYNIKIKIYRCKYNGTDNKLLRTFTLRGSGGAGAYDFTNNSCTINLYSAAYKVHFDTGKVKKTF